MNVKKVNMLSPIVKISNMFLIPYSIKINIKLVNFDFGIIYYIGIVVFFLFMLCVFDTRHYDFMTLLKLLTSKP